jgi:choline-sulfatase
VRYADRPYYGEVAAVDAALDPLLDDVRRSPDPTLVIVTGDHGEALGDHGEESHGLFAYESTLRIPFILAELSANSRSARGPGEVSSALVRHIDILPTIIDGTGQSVPVDLPGKSLLPASERSGRTERSSYFEAMSGMLNRGWAPLSGLMVGREKFIDLPLPERYDLAADPAERSNLAGRDPERDRALMTALNQFNRALPGERVAEDAEAAARLRALGYISSNAPAKRKYTDADDPKRLVELDRNVHDAVEAFTAGRADEAARIYQQILDRRPDMAVACRHLAFLRAQQGDLNGAVAVLQRGLRAGISDTRAVTELAAYLGETGRVKEAIAALEPLATHANADSDALNTLGILYAQAGRSDEARRIFERVLTINPSSSVPLENLGMVALDRGDLTTARERYRAAVAADPRSSRAHGGLGVAELRGGDVARAVDEWSRAVQLDPANFEALYNLGTTLARHAGADRARPYLEQFLKTAPPAYEKDKREVRRLLGR